MFRIYSCIATEHDLRLVIVALLICVFGTSIALTLVQRGLEREGSAGRSLLVIGGLVTGIAIWTTHFAAMLAYAPGVEVRVDLRTAILSAVLTCAIATAGWATLSTRAHGALAGGLAGVALVVAHFLDMSALRVAGRVIYDWDLIGFAIGGGMLLCILSGWQLKRRPDARPPMLASLSLALGILVLHFSAMSGVHIYPTPVPASMRLDLGLQDLSGMVIGASALILAAGLGLAYHDRYVARILAEDAERLRQSEAHYRYSVELSPQIPWIADPDGNVLEIGPRWGELVGRPSADALGQGWMQWVHPDDLAETLRVWDAAILNGNETVADTRYRLLRPDGRYSWVRGRARARRTPDGRIAKWYGSLEEIDDQVHAELALKESEERYRLAARASNDIIWDWQLESGTSVLTGALDAVLGYPEAQFTTDRAWWRAHTHPADYAAMLERIDAILRDDIDHWTQEFRLRTADGPYRDFASRGYAVRDAQGRITRLVGSMLDVTERNRRDDALRWAANHDPLTRLPNRTLFATRLDAALEDATTNRDRICLIVLDVDRFKDLNDTMGHLAGDALLREIAARLMRDRPSHATVARLDGDEFAILLPRIAADDTAEAIAGRLLQGMASPFVQEGRRFDVSVSAGAAISPEDGDDAEGLMRSADLALSSAKSEGPGLIRRFDPAMREAAARGKAMLRAAREALADDRILPFYQPKIGLRTGEIIGFEALLRWQHPRHGLQPPSGLAAAFEDVQLAPQLTERMLERVIADMAAWAGRGIAFGRIAINGSAGDFRRGDFAERILGRLAAAGLAPDRLELEVTESVFLTKQADDVTQALHQLCAAGVSIAIDDFGTGYASLTHLQQFPVDTLKIDRSFVSRLDKGAPEDSAIITALVDLARNLGIATVAEGVETPTQADLLCARGCDAAQGFLFGRAIAATRVADFLAAWDPGAIRAEWRRTGKRRDGGRPG